MATLRDRRYVAGATEEYEYKYKGGNGRRAGSKSTGDSKRQSAGDGPSNDAKGDANSSAKGGQQGRAQEQKRERDPRIFYAGQHKRKYNQKEVIDALVAADGAITVAARRLGTSYKHLKKYIDANDKLTDVIHGLEEDTLDLAEGSLRHHLESKNLTATIFYLKTKGKKRGYIEDEKVDMSKLMQPVAIVYHSPRDPNRIALSQPMPQLPDTATIDITPENAAPASEQ